jgi:1-phosphofructokinase family hexose kinase
MQPPPPDLDAVILAPNLAIDSYYVFDEFTVGGVNRANRAWHSAGGKGSNTARALTQLGGRALVIGCAGGREGRFVREELEREGIAHDLAWFDGETRRCSTLVVPARRETTVALAPGSQVGPEMAEALLERLERNACRAAFTVLTGSLPPGLPDDFYAQAVRRLASDETRITCLDSTGVVLRLACEAGPHWVKVNLQEFQLAFGSCAHKAWDCLETAFKPLVRRGVRLLIVTDGPQGAYFLAASGERFQVKTPLADWVSAVGAGDTFLAGLLIAFRHGESLPSAARYASAAAAANLKKVGCGYLDQSDVLNLLEQTQVTLPEGYEQG